MYLKKIEVFGFKSFADKTEIVFERGVTCVVGPNGCGKSNISDAIRWVLGERSAKLLRGSKMEDVIFSGTEFRKPLNLAEVSLTIDNTDQKLAIQYEEVVITRRLHRSGESEYLLNRTPCRLKDIQDLILDTGIGSNSYSMIEQGRIDYILNAEAEERRFLIEEAAGISKYKVKKEEALRKLERTEQNLLRLNDITSEVERNIKYAERQAHRAERYKEQFERLKRFEIQKAFFEINLIHNQIASLNQDRSKQQEVLFDLEEKSALHNSSARDIDERLQRLETAFFEQEGARSEAKQELSNLENQERFHQEKIDFLKLAAEKALGEIEAFTSRTILLTAELDIVRKEDFDYGIKIDQLDKERGELDSKLTEFSRETPSKDEANHQQTVLFDLAHQLTELRNSIHQVQGELVACERTKINLSESLQKLSDTKNSYNVRHENINVKRSNFEKQREENENELRRITQNREVIEKVLEDLRSQLNETKSRKTEIGGKIRLWEELDGSFGSDPKKIAAQHDSSMDGATKVLMDLIQIEPGYELAVEAALADALCAVVTTDLKTAANLLDCLETSEIKQATILIQAGNPTERFLDQAPPTHFIQKRLLDILKSNAGYSHFFEQLLANAFIVDELTPQNIFDLAPFAQDLKLVTKSGSIFGPHLQITLKAGGYTPERSALARREEVRKLEEEFNRISETESKTIFELQEKETQIKEAKETEQALNRGILELHSFLKHHEGTLTSVKEYVQQIHEEIDLLYQELKNNDHEISEFQRKLEDLNQQLSQFEQQEQKERELFRIIEQKIEDFQISKTDLENQLVQLNGKISLTSEKQSSLKKTVEFLTNQLNEHTSHISSLNMERDKSHAQVEQLLSELSGFTEKKEEISKRLFEHSVQAEQLKRERSEVFALRNKVMEDAQAVARQLETVKQNFHSFSLKELELNHQNDSIVQDLQSRYKISLSVLNAAEYPTTESELNENAAEIEKLREKLDAIGTVNLLAIDEYQELKARFDLLLTQKNDLTQSRDELFEAIRKINRTTKRLFEDTLVRVRESFREYFRSLFGGGYADLTLVDEQNPFESGLDIVARPPGKKSQHITLLSGGEKALTAIALLLSLFSVKPSPFCVLDEVDAPLDEANNDRFLNVLKPFLETTQFIIVTHSRKTIAVGDALYGVTMQEPGVSKLVSVKLAHDRGVLEHTDSKVADELNQVLN